MILFNSTIIIIYGVKVKFVKSVCSLVFLSGVFATSVQAIVSTETYDDSYSIDQLYSSLGRAALTEESFSSDIFHNLDYEEIELAVKYKFDFIYRGTGDFSRGNNYSHSKNTAFNYFGRGNHYNKNGNHNKNNNYNNKYRDGRHSSLFDGNSFGNRGGSFSGGSLSYTDQSISLYDLNALYDAELLSLDSDTYSSALIESTTEDSLVSLSMVSEFNEVAVSTSGLEIKSRSISHVSEPGNLAAVGLALLSLGLLRRKRAYKASK